MRTSLIGSPSESTKGHVVGLLVVNGFLIATMLAFAKVATSQGIPAITYAFWQVLIAGTILLLFSLKDQVKPKRQLIVYFTVSALTGVAIPNAIAFMMVTRAGAGFTGIMYALPPIFTFALATLLGIERFLWFKTIGLFIALFACIWIVLQRYSDSTEVSILWYVLGMVIPVMLSIGNVYRSIAWPKGVKSTPLAAGTLLVAAMLLGAYAFSSGSALISPAYPSNIVLLFLVQGFLTALTYLVSFELQRRSNPVFYSQLGTVAAIFGLLLGVFWFGENYSVSIWAGLLVVVVGLRIANRSNTRGLAVTTRAS